MEEISPTDSQKLLVGMRNVVSSQHGVGPGGEGFVVSFLCKLFNHQHHQIKAGRGGVTWIQSRSAGVKYRLSGGETEDDLQTEPGERHKTKVIDTLYILNRSVQILK